MALVHPRVYGGYGEKDVTKLLMDGSSPHIRGIRNRTGHVLDLDGFIPACTGDTPLQTGEALRLEVHPRVYGGHGMERLSLEFEQGSSPRVRGILYLVFRIQAVLWFIPACTGDTKIPGLDLQPHMVHPRVYGGYQRQS